MICGPATFDTLNAKRTKDPGPEGEPDTVNVPRGISTADCRPRGIPG